MCSSPGSTPGSKEPVREIPGEGDDGEQEVRGQGGRSREAEENEISNEILEIKSAELERDHAGRNVEGTRQRAEPAEAQVNLSHAKAGENSEEETAGEREVRSQRQTSAPSGGLECTCKPADRTEMEVAIEFRNRKTEKDRDIKDELAGTKAADMRNGPRGTTAETRKHGKIVDSPGPRRRGPQGRRRHEMLRADARRAIRTESSGWRVNDAAGRVQGRVETRAEVARRNDIVRGAGICRGIGSWPESSEWRKITMGDGN
ncbi:hypothetical protein C8R44DRAFT_733195 [Mycena epipterygia]|nr:hypothetical protein C8R44DRAFT_733195 [Mycena epipterygia]